MSHGQKLAEGTNVTSWAKKDPVLHHQRTEYRSIDYVLSIFITSACWRLSVTSVQTTAPLSRPHGQDHCGPGQGWNLNPAYVSGWMLGLLVIGSHGILDGELTMPHSNSLSILLKVHHPWPDNEPEGRACRGWEGGEMTCCSPWNRLNPLVSHLPSYRTRQRCHTSSKTKTEQINVNCWQRRNIKPEILKILFEILR